MQRLTQVQNKTSSNAILSQYGYTIDNAKSIRTAMSEVQGANPQRSVSYGYDAVDQLTSETSVEATLPSASTRSSGLAYDAMGNRQNQSLVQSVNGGAATNTATLYVHNKLNQMTGLSSSTDGGAATLTAFAYDASGNLTAQSTNSGGSTYTYDDADRLISLVQKDTATGAFTKKSEYVYDAYSRKAVSREYSWDAASSAWTLNEEKRRVYDGMDVVQERDGSNVTTVNYTRSGNIGGLLARSDSSGNYFFSYDGSGNVVGLTNASQQSVAEYSYDAWGNSLRATGTMAAVNSYRYSTKELQASSGLYDYGFRFYSPGLGRWINRDPIREAGGLNLYEFVGNNPNNKIDFYGLWTVGVGGELSFGAGPFGGSFEVGLHLGYDKDKGISGGLLAGGTAEYGLFVPGVSLTGWGQGTNASSVHDLAGLGVAAGGSAFAGLGGGISGLTNWPGGNSYAGTRVSGGVGTPGVEGHVGASYLGGPVFPFIPPTVPCEDAATPLPQHPVDVDGNGTPGDSFIDQYEGPYHPQGLN